MKNKILILTALIAGSNLSAKATQPDVNLAPVEQNTAAAPALDTFYRLVSSDGTKCLQSTLAGKQLQMGTEKDVESIFCLTKNGFISYVRGAIINRFGQYGAPGNAFAAEITEVVGKSGVFNIKLSAWGKGSFLYRDGDKLTGAEILAADNTAFEWKLEKVEALIVTIGETGYSTLFSPCALNIPNGLKAYTGKLQGFDKLMLSEVQNVIPANSPVIVHGKPGTYALSLSKENPAKDWSNILLGKTNEGGKPKVQGTEVDVLTLQVIDGQIGMYKYSENILKGFKVFLRADKLPAATNSLRFVFKDEVTGIESVEEVAGSLKYYDLMGRRVAQPKQGFYITSAGKKVYFK